MTTEQYTRWTLELANQEYRGNISFLFSAMESEEINREWEIEDYRDIMAEMKRQRYDTH